jgi:hypothetical protein
MFDVAAAIPHNLDHRFARLVEETVRSSAPVTWRVRSPPQVDGIHVNVLAGGRRPHDAGDRSTAEPAPLSSRLVLAPGLRRTSGASSLGTPSAARTGRSVICRIVPQRGTAAV